jgi:hypothetical protein
MKVIHHVAIGKTQHSLKIEAKSVDGVIIINPESLLAEQRSLGVKLVSEAPQYDQELANYLLNVCGLKGKDVANLMWTQPSTISKLRKGDEVNKSTWKLFLIIMAQTLDKKGPSRRATDGIIDMPLQKDVA